MVFEPALVETARGRVGLHLYDHHLPEGPPFTHDAVTGATHFAKDEHGPHQVVQFVHGKEMHAHLMEFLAGG
jgi:hypothetical protein